MPHLAICTETVPVSMKMLHYCTFCFDCEQYTVYAEYLLSTCANNDERRCQGESTYLSGKG